ncbi:alpha/beta fold hydrolase [Pigmentiphaga aceris]|uniref:Alpha/beta fold hydrolase n=1 Tax=Pigmentiphaga aceris TaxID=1940612 RepID=A0A5C0AR06_9BURK|nr:alpha/beta fold hydrolase [Pigmentiphaga aceris]QEI04512.1 alpha/beta fold hydrolase [Pigmentiphaga aceris]
MATRSEGLDIAVNGEQIAGTFLAPGTKMPGVLFVHGWGGSQQSDLVRAKGVSGLGCVCLTFDLRGHERTRTQRQTVSRDENFQDVLAAYDRLAAHPSIDPSAIAVVGSSYGGYLSAILTTLRPVKWLALHVPALYRDSHWHTPKRQLDRDDIAMYRRSVVAPADNRALAACAEFEGDVLIVESEHDDYIPHQTIMNYRAAFVKSHSLTHRILDGADHALTGELSQRAYNSILLNWTTEMVIGSRLGSTIHAELSRSNAVSGAGGGT